MGQECPAELDIDSATVWVRRHWNGWDGAKYRLRNLTNPRWDDVSGGVRSRAPRDLVHGYVMCDEELEGELAHACTHGPPPHRIKVCVVAKDNSKEVMSYLKGLASAASRAYYGRV